MAAYWQKYGLSSDPFSSEQSDWPFFYPTHWRQYIELMFHLLETTHQIIVVTGLSGSGKSALVDIFLKKMDPLIGSCRIHGSEAINQRVLENLLVQHLGINLLEGSSPDFMDELKSHLDRMRIGNDSFYLVIDDAHKLTRPSLHFLINLARLQIDDKPVLRLVLFGGPQLDALLADISGSHHNEALIHTIRLSGFPLPMVKAYLEERLSLAGYEGPPLFSEETILKILELSQGSIARINKAAQQFLGLPFVKTKDSKTHSTPFSRQPSSQQKEIKLLGIFTRYWLSLAIVTVVFFIGIVFYCFNAPSTRTNQLISSTAISLPSEGQNSITVPDESSINQVTEDSNSEENPQGLNGLVSTENSQTTSVASVASLNKNKLSIATTQPNPITSPKITLTDTDTPVNIKEGETISPSGAMINKQTSQDLTSHSAEDKNWYPLNSNQAKTLVATNPSPSTPRVKPLSLSLPLNQGFHTPQALASDEANLMKISPSHYTLQIAAAADLSKLKNYVKYLDLNLTTIKFFKTVNGHYPWYVAVYGNYPSQELAKQAVRTLPQKLLEKERPWARSFASVQKAILLR